MVEIKTNYVVIIASLSILVCLSQFLFHSIWLQPHVNDQNRRESQALTQHLNAQSNDNGQPKNNDEVDSSISSPGDPTTFSVDILSVASINRMSLLDAQRSTFASHITVRHFFNATELDDSDPKCSDDLTWETVKKVSRFCRNRSHRGVKLSRIYYYLRGQFAREQWLEKKANPVGWLCAQQRPYSGLLKVYNYYKENGEDLPDYFVMMDDDTYYNMELFEENFKSIDPSDPFVLAGCLVRAPIHMINWTFPFGGFGTIFSRGALRNLFEPIRCRGNPNPNATNQAICDRLSENLVGELNNFEEGMNLVELMHSYVSKEAYRDVDKWTVGYCMHSDWVIGFYVNFYNVSKHDEIPKLRDVPQARMAGYKDSNIYAKPTGFCVNENDCAEGSEICHYATGDWMERETQLWRLKVPDKFRVASNSSGN